MALQFGQEYTPVPVPAGSPWPGLVGTALFVGGAVAVTYLLTTRKGGKKDDGGSLDEVLDAVDEHASAVAEVERAEARLASAEAAAKKAAAKKEAAKKAAAKKAASSAAAAKEKAEAAEEAAD
jgi:hypothetical protein